MDSREFYKRFFSRRGVDEKRIDDYLSGDHTFHDPLEMTDMESAVTVTISAIKDKSHIFIFGDYDVDGISSTAMLTNFFRKMGNPVLGIVPSRDDGYGFSTLYAEKINETANGEPSLLILVDNGSKSVEAVNALNDNFKIVVLDHHTISDMTETVWSIWKNGGYRVSALVNPMRPDCDYPNKSLCAGHLSYKYLRAIKDRMNIPDESFSDGMYVQLAAFATIADVMSLAEMENRTLVRRGISEMQRGNIHAGINAILEERRIKRETVNVETLAFFIAPVINAFGRMGSPDKALRLLSFMETTTPDTKALAEDGNRINTERKDKQAQAVSEVMSVLSRGGVEKDSLSPRLLFIDIDAPVGVLGLISAQISREYSRPCLVYSLEDGVCVGSGRYNSGNSINLHEMLSSASTLFESYGGHQGAAGFRFKPENAKAIFEKLSKFLDQKGYVPETTKSDDDYDFQLELCDIGDDIIFAMEDVYPYGVENFPSPKFVSMNSYISPGSVEVFAKKHLQFFVFDDYGNSFRVISWNNKELADFIGEREGLPIKFIYKLELDTFNTTNVNRPVYQLLLERIING